VFVLLPGGTFDMGAQRRDPGATNYDPDTANDEGPVHTVTLSPFFLSKYELTQGQWSRFTGQNPSVYGPSNSFLGWSRERKPVDLTHPVEKVSWSECTRFCQRLGFQLPSEAQWEYAARADTTSPWWTGEDPVVLATVANVADAWAKKSGAPQGWPAVEWDDGNTVHAPAGTYDPNPFGLCEVLGNVWEWCQDGYDPYQIGGRDPVAPASATGTRVRRGGYFASSIQDVRCANRGANNQDAAGDDTGLRPARALTRN